MNWFIVQVKQIIVESDLINYLWIYNYIDRDLLQMSIVPVAATSINICWLSYDPWKDWGDPWQYSWLAWQPHWSQLITVLGRHTVLGCVVTYLSDNPEMIQLPDPIMMNNPSPSQSTPFERCFMSSWRLMIKHKINALSSREKRFSTIINLLLLILWTKQPQLWCWLMGALPWSTSTWRWSMKVLTHTSTHDQPAWTIIDHH